MIRELIEVGGRPLLIPLVLAAAGMYLINWLLGLERRRSERRREFLELWPKRPADDALWAEVALRHLTGEYLPQPLVAIALTLPDKASTLLDLASIWDHLQMTEAEPPQLMWKRRLYESARWRRWVKHGFHVGYFVFAGIAGLLLMSAMRGSAVASQWVWGVNAALFALMAFLSLASAHQLQRASTLAPRYIARFNTRLIGDQTSRPLTPVASTPPRTAYPDAFRSVGRLD